MKKKILILCGAFAMAIAANATPVIVAMNTTSPTMDFQNIDGGPAPEIGVPEKNVYTFDAAPGHYVLIARNGTTINGTIQLDVPDSEDVQEFKILTCTAYVTNKTDGVTWTQDRGDYRLEVRVNSREGVIRQIEIGNSTTAGRNTFLALNGDSYLASFIPSDELAAMGYMTLYRGGTLTAGVNVNGAIPQGGEYKVEIPADANFQLGMKFTHFTDFTPVEPVSQSENDGTKLLTYRLANSQIYNYRTWKSGGLTYGGYFTMNLDNTKRPELKFTAEDYNAADPKTVNHDAQSNKGYESGDILLNINERGHLKMKTGETFLAHGMRMWELTDNMTNNYFFEPDFHYSIYDPDGNPSTDVITIDNADTHNSAWSKITAIGKGTAIVTVTYDAINLNYYSGASKKEYMGGEFWGAVWPENTGVFVVTVDEDDSDADSNMVINQQYNAGALRLAGEYVDAEHDVFYYLDDEPGFYFTFEPKGVVDVMTAPPTIGENAAVYSGFSSENVTLNDDGSYTLLLTKGRNIVRMIDKDGNSLYQVLNARPCAREVTNLSRPESSDFLPGDQIKIQYSGLFHPANKIAGIYNMSAYVTYNGVPNGSSLILGSGQYTFGSAAKAQAVTVTIPENYDMEANPYWVMNEGVIQVKGYGDPVGNHRNTSPLAGRSPNFTAVAHETYFGALPDIRIPLGEDVVTGINWNEDNDKGAEYDVYDINGRIIVSNIGKNRLNELDPGLYILRQGGKASKWHKK